MNLRSPILGRFAQDVAAALGTVKATFESPVDPQGWWYLDLQFEECHVVVQQHVADGYVGVSLLSEDVGYGEKPDRVFTEYGAALAHALHLLAVAPTSRSTSDARPGCGTPPARSTRGRRSAAQAASASGEV